MLKRAGRAHDPAGAAATSNGDLTVECPACPHPGKNLPANWESAPPEMIWLCTLFLMLDANFRAKCKARGLNGFELGSGWSYFVKEKAYQAHLSKYGNQTEGNKCSAEHSAIVNANLRRNGYIASGVGAVLCARHALVRYANMDYILFTTLLGVIFLILLISYDIACQWNRNLLKRMAQFPVGMHFDANTKPLWFAIPKKHFRVHGPNYSRYSFNFLPRVGRTYGEGIKLHWSHMNVVALSARKMSPGNWQKIIAFSTTFLKVLRDAKTMYTKQSTAFWNYTATFDEAVIAQWEAQIKSWEKDMSKTPDPYEEVTPNLSQSTIRRQLAEEEAADTTAGMVPVHETTPSIFLQVGLELEEQQRALRLVRISPHSDKSATEFQEKQNLIRRRIQLWQTIQDIYMPMVGILRTTSPTDMPAPAAAAAQSSPSLSSPNTTAAVPGSKPDNIPLWLPSSLPTLLPAHTSVISLREKERRLRLAQLSDTLDDIRRLRRVLTSVTEFKHLNVSGTGQWANTRIRALYARFDGKICRCVLRYQAAYTAMEALNPDGGWRTQFLVLHNEDVRGPGREDDKASEGRHQVSWIWLSHPSSSPTSPESAACTPIHSMNVSEPTGIAAHATHNTTSQSSSPAAASNPTRPTSASEFADCMRVEWARFRARALRWEEEVCLLEEEMHHILAYMDYKASWWRTQGSRRRHSVALALCRALSIYAERQVITFDELKLSCLSVWIPYLKTFGTLPDWAVPYADVVAGSSRSHVGMGQVDDASETEELSGEESDAGSELAVM
ncbi:hypothetical protein C8Q80DRAFT_1122101 [Daedaleopsis nitida]|nr:hypothetical protein C8Q80DRAFT_1122101 [Daedaleopsis nitida]